MVEFLLTEPRALDAQQFEAAVRRELGRSRLIGESPGAMIAHEDFFHEYPDGKVAPMLTAVIAPERAKPPMIDASQSWRFPTAASVAASAGSRCVVTELVGFIHPPGDRVRAFHVSLCAAIEQLQPVGLWSPHSQQVVDPLEVAENPLAAVVNVRMFRVDSEPGVIVMDTLGLHDLGLPDVQCHFRDLDPSAVARLLYNVANYLFDAGDVIDDGETIDGIEAPERWKCQHEMALVGPKRIVLDLDVGRRHAAGRRKRSWRR